MHTAAQSDSRRIRDLGLDPGIFHTGPLNAITDVGSVQVGHRTLREGDSVRTGVPDEGSAMIVVATDAPVSPRNLERMAKRAMLGLARTGSYSSNGSGDFVVAFSTANRRSGTEAPRSDSLLPNRRMSPLFLGTVEATEEAVYNALTTATTVRGRDGHVQEALPLDTLQTLLREAGRLETE